MLFGRLALFALPFLGLSVASPITNDLVLTKRAAPVDVVNALRSAIASPISTLKTPNVSAEDAAAALTSIKSAITQATADLPTAPVSAGAKRDDFGSVRALERALAERQADDLEVVGAVLAEIIKDIIEAVEGLADELKKLPLIGAIIIDIDFGLNTLLLGLQLVLAGVVEILRGLLSGVAGLLQNLGNGLLDGLIFV
ncbi:hypothetical protein I317_02969 [Kwoniella heveanensis CBS 569]|nr:hypothetical protein I317_02969 [Kwoniella heveanensis CBS 569]